MARYRGTLQGSRGETSRLGRTELTADVNGWDIGARIVARPRGPGRQDDEIRIYATAGSNASSAARYIGAIILDDDGRPTFRPT